jgi:hypothetical protein
MKKLFQWFATLLIAGSSFAQTSILTFRNFSGCPRHLFLKHWNVSMPYSAPPTSFSDDNETDILIYVCYDHFNF